MFDNMMVKFKEFPNSVKNGIIFLITAWIAHYYFLYEFFVGQTGKIPEKILYQQIAMGVLICYFVVKIKKWARVLCLLCNALIILLYVCIVALFFSSNINYSMISLATLLLFSISTYYLAIKESSGFFKEYNKKDEETNPASDEKTEPEKN